MKSRIAVDFDGTIAKTNQLKSEWIAEHLGVCVDPFNCDPDICASIIGNGHYKQMSDEVYGNLTPSHLQPFAGALHALRWLASRHELLLVTSRGPNRMLSAIEWLRKHKAFDLFTLVVSSDNAPKLDFLLQHKCDILIDNDPAHCFFAQQGGGKAILIKVQESHQNANSSFLPVAYSWYQVISILRRIHIID